MKKFIVRFMKFASSLALSTAILSANSTCPWIIHQPKVPKEISNLKKTIKYKHLFIQNYQEKRNYYILIRLKQYKIRYKIYFIYFIGA